MDLLHVESWREKRLSDLETVCSGRGWGQVAADSSNPERRLRGSRDSRREDAALYETVEPGNLCDAARWRYRNSNLEWSRTGQLEQLGDHHKRYLLLCSGDRTSSEDRISRSQKQETIAAGKADRAFFLRLGRVTGRRFAAVFTVGPQRAPDSGNGKFPLVVHPPFTRRIAPAKKPTCSGRNLGTRRVDAIP